MLTDDERVAALHVRMESRSRRRERRRTRTLGAGCAGLALCLAFLVFGEGAAHPGGTAGLFSGATMLFENAGGYVATALLAFIAGSLVTVLCLKGRRAGKQKTEQAKEEKKNEGESR